MAWQSVEEIFRADSWIQVCLGQRLTPKSWHRLAQLMAPGRLRDTLTDIRGAGRRSRGGDAQPSGFHRRLLRRSLGLKGLAWKLLENDVRFRLRYSPMGISGAAVACKPADNRGHRTFPTRSPERAIGQPLPFREVSPRSHCKPRPIRRSGRPTKYPVPKDAKAEAMIASLLKRMTIEEKIGQLVQGDHQHAAWPT